MKLKSLSIFFPAYNEEGNIEDTVKKAIAVLRVYKFPWEMIIIDDGSTDKTGEIADHLAKKDRRIQVIHQPNGGYGLALRAGFAHVKYEWVVYMDSDGQFDFKEIQKFFDMMDNADALWGYRPQRHDPFFRLVTAKLWALSLLTFFGLWLKDVNCGFKMIKRSVVEKISPLESTRGGMINAEIAIRIQKHGLNIIQVPLTHYPRTVGHPTGVNFNVIVKSYFDLIKLWCHYFLSR